MTPKEKEIIEEIENNALFGKNEVFENKVFEDEFTMLCKDLDIKGDAYNFGYLLRLHEFELLKAELKGIRETKSNLKEDIEKIMGEFRNKWSLYNGNDNLDLKVITKELLKSLEDENEI